MKLIFLNNYDMLWYQQAWQEGREPKYHLWGLADLPKYGIEVTILPFEKFKSLKWLSQKIKVFGDLDQQFRLLFGKHNFDVVYSGHHFSTVLIALARRLGLFKKPVVTIVYQTLRKHFWSRLFNAIFVNSYDKLFCLSHEIKNDLHEFGIPLTKLEVLTQGSDLKFCAAQSLPVMENPEQLKQRLVLSTGKSQRDYPTLIEAFREIDGRLDIYGYQQNETICLPKNVNISPKFLPWPEHLRAHQYAQIVAIPVNLKVNKPLCGIGWCTVLDALAMGKPVIMTRNPYLEIDLEKAGVGLWVEPDDVQGWRQAISYLLDNPSVAAAMGKRGRQLCEEQYNMERFSEKLAVLLQDLETLQKHKNKRSPVDFESSAT